MLQLASLFSHVSRYFRFNFKFNPHAAGLAIGIASHPDNALPFKIKADLDFSTKHAQPQVTTPSVVNAAADASSAAVPPLILRHSQQNNFYQHKRPATRPPTPQAKRAVVCLV